MLCVSGGYGLLCLEWLKKYVTQSEFGSFFIASSKLLFTDNNYQSAQS